ncbi:MAG: hypothetical protein E7430_02540 [Ruminococcaceae bacterium]|nr:hypothetical protein [Oscillospiraceae bacterium]
MQASKIKNVFLLALVLVNVFLLILVIPQMRQTKNSSEKAGQELEQIFSRRGIELDWSVVSHELELYELELDGDSTAEQNAASLLLGSAMLVDDGEGLVSNSYVGQKGTAEFHKSGAFSAVLTEKENAGADLSQAGRELLESMGFVLHGDVVLTRESAGKYIVSAVQSLEGAPVYSSQAVLSYDNYCLTGVSGVWYSTYQGHMGNEKCISAVTALVSFLASQDELGWLCTSVEEVSQGYIEEATPSLGAARLVPVWKIRTDTGEFYVNGLTKEVSMA